MSTESVFLCVVVKNAPYNTDIEDLKQFLLFNGADPIHHARMFENPHGLRLFFIYFYNITSAITTVVNFNHITYYGRNLVLSMHKDSKSELSNILWGTSNHVSKNIKMKKNEEANFSSTD